MKNDTRGEDEAEAVRDVSDGSAVGAQKAGLIVGREGRREGGADESGGGEGRRPQN